MALDQDLVMNREALRVLREQLEAMTSLFGSNQQTQVQNRRRAVLATIRDLQNTHGIKLTPKDGLKLLAVPISPLRDPTHAANRKYFFDHFRHWSNEARMAKAIALRNEDDRWLALAKRDPSKVDRIRSCIKSNSFPVDVNVQDVVQVAAGLI